MTNHDVQKTFLLQARFKSDPNDNGPIGESRHCGGVKCKSCRMVTIKQTVKPSIGAVVKLRCNTYRTTANVV